MDTAIELIVAHTLGHQHSKGFTMIITIRYASTTPKQDTSVSFVFLICRKLSYYASSSAQRQLEQHRKLPVSRDGEYQRIVIHRN